MEAQLKNIGVALISVVLAILFELISLCGTSPEKVEELQKEPHTKVEIAHYQETKAEVAERVLGVELDLWLVGFGLFLSAHFHRGAKVSEFAMMVFVALLLLMVALVVVSPHIHGWRTMFGVLLPDLVGLGALGYAVVVVRSTAEGEQIAPPAGGHT